MAQKKTKYWRRRTIEPKPPLWQQTLVINTRWAHEWYYHLGARRIAWPPTTGRRLDAPSAPPAGK